MNGPFIRDQDIKGKSFSAISYHFDHQIRELFNFYKHKNRQVELIQIKMKFRLVSLLFLVAAVSADGNNWADSVRFIVQVSSHTNDIFRDVFRCHSTVITERHVLATANCATVQSPLNLAVTWILPGTGTRGKTSGCLVVNLRN